MKLQGLSSLRPLRHRNFALLWSGGLVSVVGTWMQTVAVGALVTARTGQATWTVLVAAGAFLPIGILSPVGGALADRYPRRAALILGNVAQATLASVLALLVVKGYSSPALLTFIVTLQGCVGALTSPFRQAILPDLVPRSELLAAASLGAAQFNLGRIVGPALSGITIAAFGYPVAFEANAISFLAIVIALAPIQLPPPPGADSTIGLVESMRLGAREAIAEPGCRAAIFAIAIIGLLASPFIALVPFVARQVQHGGPRALASATGLLTSMQGVGAVLGSIAISPLAAAIGRGRLLVGAICLLPFALGIYGFAPSLPTAAIAILVLGFIYIFVLSGLSTVVQLRAPTRYRGRVLSFYLVALGVSYPVGSLAQGPLADKIGLRWTTTGSAALLLLVLGGVSIFRSSLRDALADDSTTGQLFQPVDEPASPTHSSANGS